MRRQLACLYKEQRAKGPLSHWSRLTRDNACSTCHRERGEGWCHGPHTPRAPFCLFIWENILEKNSELVLELLGAGSGT